MDQTHRSKYHWVPILLGLLILIGLVGFTVIRVAWVGLKKAFDARQKAGEFVSGIQIKQADAAYRMTDTHYQQSVSREDFGRLIQLIDSDIGPVESVRSRGARVVEGQNGTSAFARFVLRGERKAAEIHVRLRLDDGTWKVRSWSHSHSVPVEADDRDQH